MISVILSLKDNKVGKFHAPFVTGNIILAKRSLYQAAIEGDSDLKQFPSSFDLYKVGEFDDTTGLIRTNDPEFIINVLTLKNGGEDGLSN